MSKGFRNVLQEIFTSFVVYHITALNVMHYPGNLHVLPATAVFCSQLFLLLTATNSAVLLYPRQSSEFLLSLCLTTRWFKYDRDKL
jgi:hypothetical protein